MWLRVCVRVFCWKKKQGNHKYSESGIVHCTRTFSLPTACSTQFPVENDVDWKRTPNQTNEQIQQINRILKSKFTNARAPVSACFVSESKHTCRRGSIRNCAPVMRKKFKKKWIKKKSVQFLIKKAFNEKEKLPKINSLCVRCDVLIIKKPKHMKLTNTKWGPRVEIVQWKKERNQKKIKKNQKKIRKKSKWKARPEDKTRLDVIKQWRNQIRWKYLKIGENGLFVRKQSCTN